MILPQMCLDCRHAHWPQHSAGECHAPTVPPNTTTQDARKKGGICGNAGILWEKTNDENTLPIRLTPTGAGD